jgi:Cft2 family RNA processing exonuclease
LTGYFPITNPMPNATTQATLYHPNIFQFTLIGHIESVDEVNYFICRDNTRFRLKDPNADYPQDIELWQVIPTTDSTGIIQTLKIDSYSIGEPNGTVEECRLLGRVVQLGKRGQFVQLKVSQTGVKTLKISLLSPDPRMKVGQLWQVLAARRGECLQILQAHPIDEAHHLSQKAQTALTLPVVEPVTEREQSHNDSTTGLILTNGATKKVGSSKSPSETPTTKSSKSFSETPTTNNGNQTDASLLAQKDVSNNLNSDIEDPAQTRLAERAHSAIAALVAETHTSDWELESPKKRTASSWEWEAFSRSTQLHARVKVFAGRKKPVVYQYPSHPNLQSTQDFGTFDSSLTHTLSDHLSVTPLGAARGIGASCFRILIGPYEVVLDCGTRPKGYDPLPALDHLKNPDLLLISHAHQDHIGAVPVFQNRFPGVRMICTPGTREIAHVMLTDCLKVQQRSEDSPELFDEIDLDRTLFRLETQPIGVDFEPLPGLKVRFINAGHILGAACIYLRYGERSLLYTGDYNTTSSRTTEGLKLAELPNCEMLITESTYGADTHPARRNQETALMKAIAEVVQSGGNVLIPAFALGRAQEILLGIRTSALFNKLKIPVFVDGLVRAVTDTFRGNLELLPSAVQNFAKQEEPFFNETSNPPIIPIGSPKERPLAMATPSVIVASSGMLTGGPSVYYAGTLLERENAAIFISGYTDEESPGRLLQNLHTGDTIELDGKEITVRARIERFSLSAHADKIGLTQVINKVNPKHLILIHGSNDTLHELARTGDLRSKHYIHIPEVGETIEYGQAPDHLSASQITKIGLPQEFEVLVEAEVEGAWLRIPEQVVENDPRWQLLATSGILKAKWDGFHLKLSPVTQQSIVRQKAIGDAIASGEDCCAVCRFFKVGSCQCEDSPLFELHVDPAGKCTEFTYSYSGSSTGVNSSPVDDSWTQEPVDDSWELEIE